MDSRTRVAIGSGTISCPAPATLTLRVSLRQDQKVGRLKTVVEANGQPQVQCGGTGPWSISLQAPSGGFKNGTGSVTAETANAPAHIRPARATASVKLYWGRK